MKAGWKSERLDALCSLFTDGDWIESKDQSAFGVRLIQTGNVGSGVFKDRSEKARYISDETFDRLRCTELKSGDCLVSRLPEPVGRACLIPELAEKAITAVDCTIIRFKASTVIPKFFVYFSQSAAYAEQVAGLTGGATRQRISRKNLGQIAIPLPPLEEQRRIVAVLDEAFAAIATATANAEKNLANARELFEGYLSSVFGTEEPDPRYDESELEQTNSVAKISAKRSKDQTSTGGREATTRPIQGRRSLGVGLQKSLPPIGWAWRSLTSIARLESGHTPSRRKPSYWDGLVPWISIRDAKAHHGETICNTREMVTDEGIANSSARVLPAGTVCLSRTASVGYVTIMGVNMATSQDFLNWVCSEAIMPEFLQFLFQSQGDDIFRFSSGAVHQTIYYPEAKAFFVCIPSLAKQREIVKQAEALKQLCHTLQKAYQTKLTQLALLRQCLLQRAFAGELTSVMPEALAA